MPPLPEFVCLVCGATAGVVVPAREMMYGTAEPFDYVQCDECGCLQIARVPEDLGRYYPDNYYSLTGPIKSVPFAKMLPKRMALGLARLCGGAVADRLVRAAVRSSDVRLTLAAIPHRRARILDVGCGGGALVRRLVDLGFAGAMGVDPFVAGDLSYKGRLSVHKANLAVLEGVFDVISFHHSFEHMPAQRAVLERARALLAADGRVLVRIPVVGGEAWDEYRADWVQLDAPRHLVLHSLDSFTRLAGEAGFAVERVVYDSTGFQFWGSELYRRGIALTKAGASPFSAADMAAWDQRACRANAAGRGDQIAAFLRPA
jgi:SAM-dependent methyltransferase